MSRRLSLALLGGLLLLTCTVYARFLSAGFAATDSLPLVETSRVANWSEALLLFTRPLMAGTRFAAGEVVYRPFVAATFGLDYALWGLNAAGYHLTNLLLHLGAVAGTWFLLTQVGLRRWSAILGAAMFALHPLVVASVPVIARRDSVVPVTAIVWAAGCLLLADRTCGRRRVLAFGASVVLVAIALLSKESAFAAVLMLPMIFAAAILGRGAGLRDVVRRVFVLVLPLVAIALVVFVVRISVLRGLGGAPDNSNLLVIDWDHYSQTLGAFTRLLAWPFAWIASSTREIWPRTAAAALLGLALTLVWLPRREALLAASGVVWVVGFIVFCIALKIATIAWLAYFSLIGVALLFAAGVDGAIRRLRAPIPRSGWRSTVPRALAGALLVSLSLYAVSTLYASALVRTYDQWQIAGDVTQRFSDALTGCLAAAPLAAQARLTALPRSFEDGRVETNLMGVTLLEDYTVDAALRLAFPSRTVGVDVSSWETLRAGAETLRFTCASVSQGTVELTTSY